MIMTKIENLIKNLCILISIFIFFSCTRDMHHHDHANTGKKIHIHGAWIRAVPPVSNMSAAYFSIMNHGEKDDKLLSVETTLSMVAEIHNVKEKDGMIKMFPVPFVPLPAGEVQNLKPGGYHIMLVKLKKTPKNGQEYELVLNFKNAGRIKTIAVVKDGGPMNDVDHSSMKHDHDSDEDSDDDY